MDGKTSPAATVAVAGRGFYISTFARLLTLDCIHVRSIDTQHLGSGTILFNPLGEPNCQWNKTCNLETSTLNIPMNLSRL